MEEVQEQEVHDQVEEKADLKKGSVNMTKPTDISGYDVDQNIVKDLKLKNRLHGVPYVYAGENETVTYKTNELVAICPKTGLPDFYNIKIDYVPTDKLCELKSLKLYLTEYRDIGIFHEHLAQKITEDFMEEVEPEIFELELTPQTRGGIDAVVKIKKYKD